MNEKRQKQREDNLEETMKNATTKRVVTGGMIYTVADILASLFFTFYLMIMNRLLPENSQDILVTVSSYLSMLKTFALLGFVGAGAKFLSEYLERDKQEARKYGISASKYNMLIIGFPIIGAAVVLFFFKMIKENDPLTTHVYFILILIVALDRLRTSSDIYILAYQRYDKYAIAYHFSSGLMYLLACITMPVFGVLGPLYSWLIGYIIMNILSFNYTRKISEFPVRDIFSWEKEYGFFVKMFKFNFLYALANLIYALLTTTLFITTGDILGILQPDERVALGVVSTFTNIILNVFGIVAGIQPAISQAFALKNRKLMENYFLASLKFPLMMSVAVITFFIIFGEEMITIFYPNIDAGMGLVILIFLIPSYTFVAFASRYDNILAGVGRPETAIIPWFIGFGVAMVGFVCTWLYVPIDAIVFGLRLQFLVGLLSMVTGLVIPGITIIIISIKVLDISIPRVIVTRTLLAAFLTAMIVLAIKIFTPLRSLLDSLIGNDAGGIAYTVIMVLGGIFLYITIGVLVGAFTRADGRFWRSVVGGIPGIKQLTSFLFSWGRFLLKHVPGPLKVEEYQWITSTKRTEMERDMEFTIEDDFEAKYQDNVIKNRRVMFSVQLKGIKQPFYHVAIYLRVDQQRIPGTLHYQEMIDSDMKFDLDFVIPENFDPGHHELYVDVELSTKPSRNMTPKKLESDTRLWSYFDFSFKWFDEKIKYIILNA